MGLTFEQAAKVLKLKPKEGPFPVNITIMMAEAELQRRHEVRAATIKPESKRWKQKKA